MQFFVKTFGCQMNEHDSEIIAGVMQSAGYNRVEDMTTADIIIVNTCCIRESAENKIWGFIGNLKNLKEHKPGLILAVVGCMTQQKTIGDMLKRQGRHLDIVLGTYQQHRLPEYVSRVLAGERQIVDISEDNRDFPDSLPTMRVNDLSAQVNIMYGCNNFCSYCIVPYVRGRERSRDFVAILAEVRELAAAGVREVMLLGQNVNSYGKDIRRELLKKQENKENPDINADINADAPDFAAVLQAVSEIEGIERIRYMSSHPRDFSADLVDVIAGLPKVRAYCHLPLQSGNDRVLRAMNRGYDTATYYAIVERMRRLVPDVVLTTDIIVGFPGETEEEFADTLEFVRKCRFDAAYTFLYSPRSGTPAAKMTGQIPELEKKSRLARLTEVQNAVSLEINQGYVGRRVEVLVEGPSKNNPELMSGRTPGNKIVIFRGEESMIGRTVAMEITGAKTWHLEAL